jgi:hypothetical protein
MSKFQDNSNRDWTVEINVATVKRVKSLVDVNLLEALDGVLLERLIEDPILLCDVLYTVCKPEADERSVSDEDFGRALAGDVIEAATAALLEALVAFFPPAKRQLLAKALEKFKAFQMRAFDAVSQRLDSPEIERQFNERLSVLGNGSGNLPASSDSIPDPTLSAN